MGSPAETLREMYECEKARADAAIAAVVDEQRRFGEMQREAWKLEEALAAARRECEGLRAALSGLMKLIDEGVIVRNVIDDGKPGWALKAMSLVLALKHAHAVLGDAALAAPAAGEEGKR